MKTELKIDGMGCDHCVQTVRKALAALPGVQSADVEVGRAVVEHDDRVDAPALSNAIALAGYDVLA